MFRNVLSSEEYDFRFDIGISLPVKKLQFSKKEELFSCMLKHFAVHLVKAELDQMLCGLSDTLHMLDLIRSYPTTFRPLFMYQKRPPLTGDALFSMLHGTYSPPGSNMREKEVAMIFIDYLEKLGSK